MPARQVRRRDRDAALRVERTAAADADRVHVRPRERRLRDGAPPELEQPLEHAVGALGGVGRLHDERVHAARRVDDARGELRAADVEREHRRAVAADSAQSTR